MTVEEEVDACFRENPHLVGRSLKEIATWFFVQGELRYSHLRQVANHKTEYYRCRLYDADFKSGEKADKEWTGIADIYKKPKLEEQL